MNKWKFIRGKKADLSKRIINLRKVKTSLICVVDIKDYCEETKEFDFQVGIKLRRTDIF